MKKIYEKPIIEEEKIEIEDVIAASSVDVNQPTDNLRNSSLFKWGR